MNPPSHLNDPARPPDTRRRLSVILVISIVLVWAMQGHHWHLNQTPYFTWHWRDLGLLPVAFALPFFAAFMLSLYLFRKGGSWTVISLIVLTATAFGLMLALLAAQSMPPQLVRIVTITRDPWENGYFGSALLIRQRGISVARLLRDYPQLLGDFAGHAVDKPPGLILLELLVIHFFGTGWSGAMASGVVMGMLGALSAPAVFVFIRYFSHNRAAAFCGAAFVALCPALLLFFPRADQCFALFSVGLTILWAQALCAGRFRFSALAGILMGVALFFTFLPLVLGMFFCGYAVLDLVQHKSPRRLWWIVAHGAVFAGCLAIVLLALWGLAGYNALATFQACRVQNRIAFAHAIAVGFKPRLLPLTIPFDLYDFALGSGWISFVLVGFYFWSGARDRQARSHLWITIICISQFVIVALCGAIPGETARVWMFMLPMLMLPVGLELSSWSVRGQIAAFAVLLWITATVDQCMSFTVLFNNSS